MNTVMLVGRLTQDPDVRYTKTGKAVASFSIAVNRYVGQSEATDFVPIVAWERLAEMCGNNLAKGQRVFVQGRLQIRSYETTDGQKRRVAEVVAEVIAQNFEEAAPRGQGKPVQASAPKPADNANQFGSDVLPDEEIPF